MSRLLRGVGFKPYTFQSAESFLSDPRRKGYACLLVEIQLPGISGLELQRRLLTERDETPVIFVTSQDDPVAREVAVRNGCAHFFRKVDPGADIIDALRRVMSHSERR